MNKLIIAWFTSTGRIVMTSWPKKEDNIKNEDDLKNEDNLNNEDKLKNEEDL